MGQQKQSLISALLWLGSSVIWFTMANQNDQPILYGVGGIAIMVGMEYLNRWRKLRRDQQKQDAEKKASEKKALNAGKKKK